MHGSWLWLFGDEDQDVMQIVSLAQLTNDLDAQYCDNIDYGQKLNQPMRCARCKSAFYCSKRCQVKAWKDGHRQECKQG